MAVCKTTQEIKHDMTALIELAKQGKLGGRTKQYSCGDGLYICVNNNTGAAVWRARVSGIKGEKCQLGVYSLDNNRMTLATARKKLQELKDQHQTEQKKKSECPTVWEYFNDTYYQYKCSTLKARSNKTDLMHLFRDFLKGIHNVQLCDVDCKVVTDAIDALKPDECGSKKKPISTLRKNNAITKLTAMMDYAKWRGVIKINPLSGLTKLYKKEQSKPRKFAPAEELLEKVLHPLKDIPEFYRAIFLLLTLTGLRLSEAVSMKWEYIDGKRKFLSIPPTALNANKLGRGDGSGRPIEKPLTPHVIEVLQYLAAAVPIESEFVCQSPRKKENAPISTTNLRETYWNRYVNPDGKVVDMHGFRSTVSTYLEDAGYDVLICELAISHEVRSKLQRTYDRRKLWGRVQDALTDWENYIVERLPEEYLKILEIGRNHPIEWK